MAIGSNRYSLAPLHCGLGTRSGSRQVQLMATANTSALTDTVQVNFDSTFGQAKHLCDLLVRSSAFQHCNALQRRKFSGHRHVAWFNGTPHRQRKPEHARCVLVDLAPDHESHRSRLVSSRVAGKVRCAELACKRPVCQLPGISRLRVIRSFAAHPRPPHSR